MREKITTEEFILRAKDIHGATYDYSRTKYYGFLQNVLIVCPIHGEFEQRADHHLAGIGCPSCARKGQRKTTKEFIEQANEVHNNFYDYRKTCYTKARQKVIITCPLHGDFLQTPNNHLNGQGCPECGRIKTDKKRMKTTEKFIHEAQEVHGNRYGYSLVDYRGNKRKVKILCYIHGVFEQSPILHLHGAGCPVCGCEQQTAKRADGLEIFIHKARQRHGDLYSYEKTIYRHSHSKVIITCKLHGDFEQTPYTHTQGAGCPICGEIKRLSSAQKSLLEEELNDLLVAKFGNDDILRQYKDDARYPFHCDFYIKSKDLFIELNAYWSHGKHFFDPNNSDDLTELEKMKSKKTKTYEDAIHTWTVRDPLKRKTAEENNLNYLVFWDNDLTDAKAWLETQ